MFCSNCGKQIPENTKFCNHCGAQQNLVNTDNAVTQQQNASTQPSMNQSQGTAQQTKANKPPKKKANIVIVLAVFLCAFLIGKFAIAPSMTSDSDNNGGTGNQGNQSQQSTQNNGGSSVQSSNAAYDAIFDDTYIVHFQSFFNMDMSSFALKQDDGIICCADYGYDDDVVKQWVETMYIPVSEYTDTQKTDLETTMKSQFATIDALNCCSVTYKMSANYFTITCTYSDVDKAENYGELYNAGVMQTNTFISMSATETSLLGQGFVKK